MNLIQPLRDGPLDIVGDVHGELEALLALLSHLGYRSGKHPDGRRLVFLGDLTDRGPDSPGVVCCVQDLVEQYEAQCVLGNHELNLLLGERKHDNGWFTGEPHLTAKGELIPQVYLSDVDARESMLAFFTTLPLALESEQLRIVHACWEPHAVAEAREATSVLELYHQARHRIAQEIAARESADPVECQLLHQNNNPVKVLSSGIECRAEQPFYSSGKLRHEQRVRWWEHYHDQTPCVFGHYSRRWDDSLECRRALCMDYGAGKRCRERLDPDFDGAHIWRLAALRWPERILVFANGERCPAPLT